VAVKYQRLVDLLEEEQPDAVVHFAEQRAAPYTMKGPKEKIYTVHNNLNATHNLLCAVVELGLGTHVVHMGTMGVYGYGTAGMKIPEGYLPVKIELPDGTMVEQEILYPVNPPAKGERVKILNQMTETHRVRDLARMIADMAGASIENLPNPRNEDDENELHVENNCFLELGLEPTTLEDGLLQEVSEIARKYKDRCDLRRVKCVSYWNKDRAEASASNA